MDELSYGEWDEMMGAVEAAIDAAGREDDKFTDDDVVMHDLLGLATRYATTYDGDFNFVLEMQDVVRWTGSLSIPQARGVMNCARQEWLRGHD